MLRKALELYKMTTLTMITCTLYISCHFLSVSTRHQCGEKVLNKQVVSTFTFAFLKLSAPQYEIPKTDWSAVLYVSMLNPGALRGPIEGLNADILPSWVCSGSCCRLLTALPSQIQHSPQLTFLL